MIHKKKGKIKRVIRDVSADDEAAMDHKREGAFLVCSIEGHSCITEKFENSAEPEKNIDEVEIQKPLKI
jgi:hypothetical protein